MKMLRYRIARHLIHLGLRIMPTSRYKSDLLYVLGQLQRHVALAVETARGHQNEERKNVH